MKNILVAESEGFESVQLQDSLRKKGYNVYTVPDSDTRILDEITARKPDLVILRLTQSNSDMALMIHENFNVPVMHLNETYQTEQLAGLIEKILTYLPAFSILSKIFF